MHVNALSMPVNVCQCPVNACQCPSMPCQCPSMVVNALSMPVNARQCPVNARQCLMYPCQCPSMPYVFLSMFVNALCILSMPVNALSMPVNVCQCPVYACQCHVNARLCLSMPGGSGCTFLMFQLKNDQFVLFVRLRRMSCFGLQFTCKHKPKWIKILLLNDVSQSQYEKEIARLEAHIEGLHAEYVGMFEDNYICSVISAIRLSRFFNLNVLPRLRTQRDAFKFEQHDKLTDLIESYRHHKVPSKFDLPGFVEKYKERVWPVKDQLFYGWGFFSPDYSTLRQFRQRDNECQQLGVGIIYDKHGLAQTQTEIGII